MLHSPPPPPPPSSDRYTAASTDMQPDLFTPMASVFSQLIFVSKRCRREEQQNTGR